MLRTIRGAIIARLIYSLVVFVIIIFSGICILQFLSVGLLILIVGWFIIQNFFVVGFLTALDLTRIKLGLPTSNQFILAEKPVD